MHRMKDIWATNAPTVVILIGTTKLSLPWPAVATKPHARQIAAEVTYNGLKAAGSKRAPRDARESLQG